MRGEFVYNSNMTLQNLIEIKPVTRSGENVVLSETDYEALRAACIKAYVMADIEESRKQIRAGKTVTMDEFFSRLEARYGF